MVASPSETAAPVVPSEGRFDSGSGHATDWQQEWNLKYGWNRPGDDPVVLNEAYTTVRKVEIHDVYDLDRWWWRATDGIRETTWPGVFNRSRLIGRDDYFELPDWDCYSLSGKTVTFYMPNEPWNHLEIAGGAWGTWTLLAHDKEKATDSETTLFERPKGQEITYHQFDNAHHRPEDSLHQCRAGAAHRRVLRLLRSPRHGAHRRRHAALPPHRRSRADDNPSTVPLVDFIEGRFPPTSA